jgi:hypothetical protein
VTFKPICRKIYLPEYSQVRVRPDARCSVGVLSRFSYDTGIGRPAESYGYGPENDVHVIEADNPSGDYCLVLDRAIGCHYQIVHDGKVIEEGYFRPDGSKRNAAKE